MVAKREMHGLSHVNGKRTPLHALWLRIRNRCNNPHTPDYKYYGGRGIKVCDRWDRFIDFADDVGPHPGEGWTLDRIDNDGDYEPSNVRWATRQTQARNRNYVRLNEEIVVAIREIYGPYKRWAKSPRGVTQEQLAKKFGVTQGMISAVLRGDAWHDRND